MAVTLYDYEPLLKRGHEYTDLKMTAIQMGAVHTSGEKYNTGLGSSLVYAAWGIVRATTVLKQPGSVMSGSAGCYVDPADPGVVVINDTVLAGTTANALMLWHKGGSNNVSATASNWLPVSTSPHGIMDMCGFFDGLHMAALPMGDITSSEVVTTAEPGIVAMAYDQRGSATATGLSLTHAAQPTSTITIAPTGTVNTGTVGRLLYWYTH